MKYFVKNNYYELIVLFFSLALFVLTSWYIYKEDSLNIIDLTIRDAIYNFRGEKYGFWFYIFRLITEFGFFYIVALIAVGVAIYTRFDRRFWTLSGATIITYLSNELIKVFFLRERPVEELQWMQELSTSYPSGHSMVSIVFYGLLLYFIRSSDYLKEKKKNILTVIFIILLILIGISRMVLGVHYFTDVIGGYLCGLVLLMMYVICYKSFIKKRPVVKNLTQLKSL